MRIFYHDRFFLTDDIFNWLQENVGIMIRQQESKIIGVGWIMDYEFFSLDEMGEIVGTLHGKCFVDFDDNVNQNLITLFSLKFS